MENSEVIKTAYEKETKLSKLQKKMIVIIGNEEKKVNGYGVVYKDIEDYGISPTVIKRQAYGLWSSCYRTARDKELGISNAMTASQRATGLKTLKRLEARNIIRHPHTASWWRKQEWKLTEKGWKIYEELKKEETINDV